mgnify:CR=1 FL=1
MKLTRESLKNLIVEALEERGPVLLESPGRVLVEKHGHGHEGAMAKKELYHMAQKANQLHELLADDEDLDEWVQSKITKAAAMVGGVFDHIMYQKRPGHVEE